MCDWWLTGIFEDDEVTHVEGDVDPVRDMEIIHEELRLKDLEYLDKTVDHMERVVIRGGDKSRKAEYVRCSTVAAIVLKFLLIPVYCRIKSKVRTFLEPYGPIEQHDLCCSPQPMPNTSVLFETTGMRLVHQMI